MSLLDEAIEERQGHLLTMDRQARQVFQLAVRLKRALDLLEEHQWAAGYEGTHAGRRVEWASGACPECEAQAPGPHLADCELDAVLGGRPPPA